MHSFLGVLECYCLAAKECVCGKAEQPDRGVRIILCNIVWVTEVQGYPPAFSWAPPPLQPVNQLLAWLLGIGVNPSIVPITVPAHGHITPQNTEGSRVCHVRHLQHLPKTYSDRG